MGWVKLIFLRDICFLKVLIKTVLVSGWTAILNSKTVMTRKKDPEGIDERIHLLQRYLPLIKQEQLRDYAIKFKCGMDDIIDAICLSVTANLAGQNRFKIIPHNPMEDDTRLLMQMVIPD